VVEIVKINTLVCPLCEEALLKQERQWRCVNGHSFDIAKQGYVNLLPVQNKKSRAPGDSKAMVEARQRFLDSGVYQPIAERLVEIVDHCLSTEASLLDAGCGEGYYLDYLAKHLQAAKLLNLIGLDIAKPAVLAAAKRNRQLDWLVASNRQPPVSPASVDVIICMFGFPVYEAFKKILKPGGSVILVESGRDHLIELRRIIYPEIKEHRLPSLEKAFEQGFELVETSELNYAIETLPKSQLDDLLLMTPHLFRASYEGKQKVAELQQIDLTVDVVFRRLVLAE